MTIQVGTFTKRLRVRGDVEISCPWHERKTPNIMVNTLLRRPTRLRGWTIAVAVVTALVTGLGLWGNHMQLNQERSEMANTKIVYVPDPVQKLVQRTDGSYYKTTSSHGTYYYTTIEDLIVVPRSVSAEERRAQPSFLWPHSTITNDITVRIIDPHEADRTPRLEREHCTVKPIDASKPSYTGDPHARGRLKIGADQEDTDVVILSGLFNSDGGQQLCQDRITIRVPDDGIQP
ncbi:hypothetical protein AB0387_19900 [Streptomyces sp. NPDC089173]|uniref:hypothetical protein n=1 Tax=Streptomyces sp. NPDC089173 TaxID=3154965 RepID=UPI0034506D1B